MSYPRLRVFVKHKRDCTALKQGWRDPWAFGLMRHHSTDRTYDSLLLWRHPTNGKRLRFPYVGVICNSTDCRAIAGFRLKDVEKLLFGPKTR